MKKIFIILSLILILFLSGCWLVSEGTKIGDSTSSKYGIEFNDMLYQRDGFEKELLISGTLPTGFNVKYYNNKGTDVGYYYATCEIYDSSNKLVETHNATLVIENRDNFSFNAFINQFFKWYIGEDQFAINILFESPAEFNLKHYDAKWYSYDEEYTPELLDQYADAFEQMLGSLESYNGKLNRKQKIAYDTLDNFFSYYSDLYSIPDVPYLSNRFIDQFGGYVANFISSIEAYNIRNEQDIVDMIDLIESTDEAFNSYVNFAKDKVNKGYAYSDYTLNEMIKYLDDLLLNRNDFYLVKTLENKILNSNVDSSKHSNFIKQIESAFYNCFFKGVEDLKNGLIPYIGLLPTSGEGYLTKYQYGKEYYKLELSNLLGIKNIDMSKYYDIINDTFEETNRKYNEKLISITKKYNFENNKQINDFLTTELIFDGTVDEMMEYLKNFAKKIVPELKENPNIIINQMDDATSKVSNAVAYYTKSAIDSVSEERITLNPLYLSDKNDVLSTLAHEGYPGHLYSYCYMKQLDIKPLMKIMTSTAHAEGWATYVSLALYDDVIKTTSNQKLKDICEYLYNEQLNSYLLETKIDLELHMNEWSSEDLYFYLKENGYNYENTSNIYNRMIEIPVTYNAYSFGKIVFYNLHENAKNTLKSVYDEIEFNNMLLSNGWIGMEPLLETYNEYMQIKCHKYNIEYTPVKSIYEI